MIATKKCILNVLNNLKSCNLNIKISNKNMKKLSRISKISKISPKNHYDGLGCFLETNHVFFFENFAIFMISAYLFSLTSFSSQYRVYIRVTQLFVFGAPKPKKSVDFNFSTILGFPRAETCPEHKHYKGFLQLFRILHFQRFQRFYDFRMIYLH